MAVHKKRFIIKTNRVTAVFKSKAGVYLRPKMLASYKHSGLQWSIHEKHWLAG